MTTPRLMHVCGCNAFRPCAKAEGLFLRGQAIALAAHLERTAQAFLDGKRCHRESLSYAKVPKMGAPSWKTETRPLLKHLQAAPRDWPMLESWAAANRVEGTRLRNQVAWLEEQRFIESQVLGVGLIWRACS